MCSGLELQLFYGLWGVAGCQFARIALATKMQFGVCAVDMFSFPRKRLLGVESARE